EDYPVLFELDRLRATSRDETPAPVPTFDCVVLDEAQELSPLELALIGRAVAPGGTIVVAGDAAQQVDPAAAFTGWDATLAALGPRDFLRARLTVNHRCPPDVTRLARQVAGLEAGPVVPVTHITRETLPSALHLTAWVADALDHITTEDPQASVAVLCRTREAALALYPALHAALDVRLALDGRFELRPGVSLTAVEEVKGLEFDDVIVADADARSWPDEPGSRRALYVALTRATRRLVLAAERGFSPLLEDG
ncbi:MAG: ATP-binding domain-containing protein, partial [Myxococcales bacterium]